MGVSLVAIAAIVATLTVARRQEEPAREKGKRAEHSPAAVDLDQLRAAGL